MSSRRKKSAPSPGKPSKKDAKNSMETSSIDEKSYETLSSPSLYLFGLATHENEEGETVWTPLLKYIILGLICVLSFSIRLFAIVRYESVRFFIIIFKKLGKKM